PRPHLRAREPGIPPFREIPVRRKPCATNPAEVGDRERAAFHIGWGKLLVACFLGELSKFRGQLNDVLLVHITNYRNEQSAIRIYRYADVDELLVNNLFLLHINGGIELREDLQC